MFEEEMSEQKPTPQIGEIWSVAVPEFYFDEENSIIVRIQKRPFIVLDDGRGLIVEENEDYHCYKVTTKRRVPYKPIKNWKEKGLHQESFYRIEMPLKIELHQFNYKIGALDDDEMKEIYKDILGYVNVETLKKISNSDKETEQR